MYMQINGILYGKGKQTAELNEKYSNVTVDKKKFKLGMRYNDDTNQQPNRLGIECFQWLLA